MRYPLLSPHKQEEILFTINMYRKDIERTCFNKLTKLISNDMEKNYSKSISDASNSSDTEEEIF